MATNAATTPVALVILSAARDRAVTVNDERTGTGHAVTLRGESL
jgi:hypothetical protein